MSQLRFLLLLLLLDFCCQFDDESWIMCRPLHNTMTSYSKWEALTSWVDRFTDKLCIPFLGEDNDRTCIVPRDGTSADELKLPYKWEVIYWLKYTGAVAIAFSLILTAVLVDDMHHIEENSMTFNGLPGQVGEKTITIPRSSGGWDTFRFDSVSDQICSNTVGTLPTSRTPTTEMLYSDLAACESNHKTCGEERHHDSLSRLALSLFDLGLAGTDTNSDLGSETFASLAFVSNISRVLDIMALVAHGLAFAILIIVRRSPRTLLLHKNSKGSIWVYITDYSPNWLVLFAGVALLVSNGLRASFRHSLASHVAAYAIHCHSSPGDPLAAAFLPQGDKPANLNAMVVFGKYVHSSSSSGLSMQLLYVVILIDVLAAVLVIWAGSRGAYSSSRTRLTNSQLDRLPFYSKIWNVWLSFIFFIFAMACTTASGYSVRRRGYLLNVEFWSIDRPTGRADLDDILLNHLGYSYASFDVADFATVIALLIAFLVWLVTPDKTRFLSKYLQLVGLGYLLRAIIMPWTVLPAPFSVLQFPQCFETPGNKIFGDIITLIFCNDMMYSGHAAFICIPIFIAFAFVEYGPIKRKALAWLMLLGVAVPCVFLIVIARGHYSIDILVSVVVSSCFVLLNIPAWKLLFDYGKGAPNRFGKVSDLLAEAYDCFSDDDSNSTTAFLDDKDVEEEPDWISIEKKISDLSDKVKLKLSP